MNLVDERRLELIRWMRERPEHNSLTVGEITNVSGVFDGQPWNKAVGRCFADLEVLRRREMVRRVGRPARWSVIR